MSYAARCVLSFVLLCPITFGMRTSEATWSICVADSESKEVAVGTVTCLNQFDLLNIVPVIVVGKGAGACQAAGDFQGIRRPIMFQFFEETRPLSQLMLALANISGHQSRQYGLAATYDTNTQTFTGASNGAWAGGVVGSDESLSYAIQGNVLTGECVIDAIEAAVLSTNGDVAEKLMAGMQAARSAGGDGRCSCSQGNPPGCGCPPESFTKSGHIGGMVVARIGDIDDTVCNASGCVDGNYFMRLNVAFQSSGAPDPVEQLQMQFDDWRATLTGRVDAIATTVSFDPPFIPANGSATTTMRIAPRTWDHLAVTVPIESIEVVHGDQSDGLSTIGAITTEGDGTIAVELTAGDTSGLDRFTVTLDDGVRPVVLMPEPRLTYFEPGDLDGDGTVGFTDLLSMLAAWGPCGGGECAADLDGDGAVTFNDLLTLLANWS